jgi:dihydrofolate reductase
MPKISIIAAMSENRAIGLDNSLPWCDPIPADWENLEKVTQGKKMIMGRKSYDNPHRVWSKAGNFVITRQKDYLVEDNFEVVHSLKEALEKCKQEAEVYIIGGEEIFKQAMSIVDKIVLTIVHQNFHGDTFFPEFVEKDFSITSKIEFKKGENTAYPISILTFEKL